MFGRPLSGRPLSGRPLSGRLLAQRGLHASGKGVQSVAPTLGEALAVGSGSGWSSNVQYWSLSGATAGRPYQLRFTITGATGKADYFDFACCNADDSLVEGSKSGEYSYDGTHTFDFKAVTGASRIRATRQAGFTGTITIVSCNEIVQSSRYATPAPKARQLFSHTTSLLDIMWRMDFADFADVTPDTGASSTRGVNTGNVVNNVGLALTSISNATPAVVTRNNHGYSNGDAIELTTTVSLPAGLSPNVTYYVVNAATNTFELALSPGGASIATTSAGSGSHRSAKSTLKYLMSGARAYDATDIFQLSSHTGMTIIGTRHQLLHPTLNSVYGMFTSGKRNGNIGSSGQAIPGQYNTFGDVKIEGLWSDMHLDGHHNRFDFPAVADTVTITNASPAVLTHTLASGSAPTAFGTVASGLPCTLTTTGSLPTGLNTGTTYYLINYNSGAKTFNLAATPTGTAINTSSAGSGTHTINIAATANAGPISMEGNPNNRSGKALIANVKARNVGDSIADLKHPNAWGRNITYDMSNGGYNTPRALMTHSYEFDFITAAGVSYSQTLSVMTVTAPNHGLSVGRTVTTSSITGGASVTGNSAAVASVPDANTFTIPTGNSGSNTGTLTISYADATAPNGIGFLGVMGFVCPDLYALDGLGNPLRQESKRCKMPIFDTYIGGEKIVSLAHARARNYWGVVSETTFGAVTDTEVPVYQLPPDTLPAWAYWPVLMIEVQVRKNGTSTWYNASLPYGDGPFPAGALQYQIDVTAISGAGIVAGDTIDVRLGHYDGIAKSWVYAGADGVAAYSTLTLGAGLSAELTPILAAGATLTGLTGTTNWAIGFDHTSGSTQGLRYSSAPFTPSSAKDYLFTMTIGAVSAQQVKVSWNGASSSGDNHGIAGTFKDELAGAGSTPQILPAASTFVGTGVRLSTKQVSYLGDAA